MILEYIATCCDRINKRGCGSLLQRFNMGFLEFCSKLSNLNELDIDEDFNCDRLVEDNCDRTVCGSIVVGMAYPQSNQFSKLKAGTRSNSRVFAVTRVRSRDKA
jgi:hypothetical protein